MEDKKEKHSFRFIVTLTITFALVGSGISLILSKMVDFKTPSQPANISSTSDSSSLKNLDNTFVFNPPKIEDAPEDIRDAVTLGYNIMMHTKEYAGDYIGNELTCSNCHFDGGRDINTLSLVGVAAKYPKYRKRSDFSTDLESRTQGCFERSINGTALPHSTQEMEALMAYYHWISRGIPVYADVPWLGNPEYKSDHKPDKENGKVIWAKVCAQCHGQDGHGTLIAPPIWGPGSFNDGAGMSKVSNMAPFAYHYMPKGNPTLTKDEALDVAEFATNQPRPHFTKTKPKEPDKW